MKMTSDIKLVFNSSTIAMMHGPINIRCLSDYWFYLELLNEYGDRGSTVVKVLFYKSESHWFDSRRL